MLLHLARRSGSGHTRRPEPGEAFHDHGTMTMVMKDDVISASQLKARCLALLDDVAETGRSIVVTKRGKPVARLSPVEGPASLHGTVTYLVDEDELLEPIDVEWNADE